MRLIRDPVYLFSRGLSMSKGVATLAGILLMLIQISGFAHGKSDRTDIELPPLEPDQNEIMIEDDRKLTEGDREFVDKCMARVMRDVEGKGRVFGNPLITKSEKFGIIFRVELEIRGVEIHGHFNRFVCWIRPDTKELISWYAFGQKGDPLP